MTKLALLKTLYNTGFILQWGHKAYGLYPLRFIGRYLLMRQEQIKEPGHDLFYHTEACFQRSMVIECNGVTDKRKCLICGKEWTEPCNFDDDFS